MKHWIGAALVCFCSMAANATPYFRLLDLNSPQTSMGAYIDPANPGNTAFGTSLAIVTHSPKDGCLLPGISCEDWSPLALDYSANGGQILFGLGPSANLAPMIRQAAASGIMAVWGDKYVTANNIASALQPSQRDLDIAFGPKWMVVPSQNWKGYFRIAAGVAWKW